MAEFSTSNTSSGGAIEQDVATLFANLAQYQSLLVAVSGGADSVALLHLLARWARRQGEGAPRIEVATIDHGLRDGSQEEARWVGELSQELGFTHHVRRWQGEKPTTGVQSLARKMRYQLLLEIVDAAALKGPVAIVTAHTQDDQAETVLMRLARGSGIDGVGAMDDVRALNPQSRPVDLVRPLLGIAKDDLIRFLTRMGQGWKEDPSNVSRDYERVRLRDAMPSFAEIGVTPAALALTAQRARRARAALDALAQEFVITDVDLNNGVCASMDVSRFRAQPEELRIRILNLLVRGFGGTAAPPRLQQLETVVLQLFAGSDRQRLTLGGSVVDQRPAKLNVYREVGRQPLPQLELQPGDEIIWDQRFLLSRHVSRRDFEQNTQHPAPPIEVRALPEAVFARLRPALIAPQQALPARVAQTLPSFWYQDQLLSVPPLNVDQLFLAQNVPDLMSAAPGPQYGGHSPCTDLCHARFVGLADCQSGTGKG